MGLEPIRPRRLSFYQLAREKHARRLELQAARDLAQARAIRIRLLERLAVALDRAPVEQAMLQHLAAVLAEARAELQASGAQGLPAIALELLIRGLVAELARARDLLEQDRGLEACLRLNDLLEQIAAELEPGQLSGNISR